MDYMNILKKMKKHFPRWMDIRRKSKSSGLNILTVAAKQISSLYDAIEDYKKDFFIDNYEGRENEIISFLYRANVGEINIDYLSFLDLNYKIASSKDEFYNNEDYVYYEAPYIYIKNNIDTIQYFINGYKYESKTEKINVWNIFDEFAVFVGLRRFENETNKELVNRILEMANVRPNSSSEKLKQAIIANLTNYENISEDEIIIERSSPENLKEYYNEFETILDNLEKINRDVYKNKTWDIDTWTYKFQKIDYMPHAWDVLLASYANGIGNNDDLKVKIINENSKTAANFYFYKKNIQTVSEYIKNKNLKKDLNLSLYRYNDYLSPELVSYELLSSPAIQIDPKKIIFNIYSQHYNLQHRFLQDIIDEKNFNNYNFEVQDYSILKKNTQYKITFEKETDYEEFRIKKIILKNSEGISKNIADYKIKDFIKEGTEIKHRNSNYDLIDISNFSNSENCFQTYNGISIKDITRRSFLSTNIENVSGQNLSFKYKTTDIPLLRQFIDLKNCYYDEEVIVSDNSIEDNVVNIKTTANYIKFNASGNFTAYYSIDGKKYPPIQSSGEKMKEYSTIEFFEPRKIEMQIMLNPIDNIKTKIKDILYNKYFLNIELDEESLIESNVSKKDSVFKIKLPENTKENVKLNIHMQTYTGFPLLLEKIYIGESTKDSKYSISFTTDEEYYIFDFETSPNISATLEERSSDNKIEKTFYNYFPKKSYKALQDNSLLKLDLSQYESIISIKTNVGEIITSENKNYTFTSYLKLMKNEEICFLDIIGNFEKNIYMNSLKAILEEKIDYKDDDKVYISNISKDIIVDRKSQYIYCNLEKKDICPYKNITKTIIECNESIMPNFLKNEDFLIAKNEINLDYDKIFFTPTIDKTKKIYKDYKMMVNFSEKIKITNNRENKEKLFFKVKSLNKNYDINLFNDEKTQFEEGNKVSLDAAFIQIKSNVPIYENKNLNKENINLTINTLFGKTINLNKMYVTDTNLVLDLAKYNIVEDNFKVIYLNNENKFEHFFIDKFKIDSSMFNKLTYCNIEEIEEIAIYPSNTILKKNIDYKIFEKEGIICWNNSINLKEDELVKISYYYKQPYAIELSKDILYSNIDYDIDSYELLTKIELLDIKNQQQIDLNSFSHYEDADFVSVECSEPGFKAEINKNIVTFKLEHNNKKIAIKTGYYYMDGLEYYLFNNMQKEDIKNSNFITSEVTNNGNYLSCYKSTANFVKNSKMISNSKNNIFSVDFKTRTVDGVSDLKKLTTCNTYNYWNSFGMNAEITKGLNDNGIHFYPSSDVFKKNSYAYLDITDYLKKYDSYILSLYAIGKFDIYIAEGKEFDNANYNGDLNIELKNKLIKSISKKDIYEITITPKENIKYYLVVFGDIVIDDLILQDLKAFNDNCHNKNIDILNYNLKESIYSNYTTRLNLQDNQGSIFKGTEKNNNNEIYNSSYISWGYTKKKSFRLLEDLSSFYTENVSLVNCNDLGAFTTNGYKNGKIITPPIFVGKSINNIVVKVNDVLIANMTNLLSIDLLTCATDYGDFTEIMSSKNSNMLDAKEKNIMQYIKVAISIPPNKCINSIDVYVEYKSNEQETIGKQLVYNGEYISKIYDTMYTENYKVENLDIKMDKTLSNYCQFYIRATKTNKDKAVWTEWKKINLDKDFKISNDIYFDNYRYFQFKVILIGENTSVVINNLDLKVI